MTASVIAIGLDSTDPQLLECWMKEGHLPNLRRLRKQGSYGRVQNIEHYRAETPWTSFLTGCSPEKTGYWSPIKFCSETYDAKLIEAYDFSEYPPFYALDSRKKIAVLDMPHARLSDDVNGVQVLAWGAHSPQGPSESIPANLFQELVDEHGAHPGLRNDHASCFDLDALKQLEEKLLAGIARRTAIALDLLARDEWDLFLTVFGETHSAGHFMWHLSQPNHPLYDALGKHAKDSLLIIFQAIDRAVAQIVNAAGVGAQVMVFSVHGMDTNVMDLPSMFFLPEFMYRWNFPGRFGLAKGKTNHFFGNPILNCKKGSWLWEVWSSRNDPNFLRRFVRRQLPYRVSKILSRLWGEDPNGDLVSPFTLRAEGYPLFFQAASWYRPSWKQMKAFALPSFSEGYIRINLKGRDAEGIVEPEDYEQVCDEVEASLRILKDARTGTPMVKKIIRTRRSAEDCDPKRPDADLVVIWQESCVADAVESFEIGRIGPVPHFRTGSHRAEGFFIGNGRGFAPGSVMPTIQALDLPPTLLSFLNAPIPDYFEGACILEEAMSSSRG